MYSATFSLRLCFISRDKLWETKFAKFNSLQIVIPFLRDKVTKSLFSEGRVCSAKQNYIWFLEQGTVNRFLLGIFIKIAARKMFFLTYVNSKIFYKRQCQWADASLLSTIVSNFPQFIVPIWWTLTTLVILLLFFPYFFRKWTFLLFC